MANLDERIAELQKRQDQLQARKKKLLAQKSQQERKARTKRLIEVGATVESVLKRPIEKEDLPLLLNFLNEQEKRGHFFSKAMEKKETGNDESIDDFFMSTDDFQ